MGITIERPECLVGAAKDATIQPLRGSELLLHNNHPMFLLIISALHCQDTLQQLTNISSRGY